MALINERLLVVALHGFFGCAEDFKPLEKLLRPHCDWVSLELPGHTGKDDPQESFSLEKIFSKIDSARQDRSVILLGYSMGGRLALQYSVNYSQSLMGLVLIGASPGIEDPVERQVRYAHDLGLAQRFESQSVRASWKEWVANPLVTSQSNIPQVIHNEMIANRMRHFPHGLAQSLREWSPGFLPSLWGKLHQIQCSVLLINGDMDEKFMQINSKIHKESPKSFLRIIEKAGHMAHLENINSFSKVLIDWLQGVY